MSRSSIPFWPLYASTSSIASTILGKITVAGRRAPRNMRRMSILKYFDIVALIVAERGGTGLVRVETSSLWQLGEQADVQLAQASPVSVSAQVRWVLPRWASASAR